MEDLYTVKEKIALAQEKRKSFQKLKQTAEFKRWRRRQYDRVQKRKCAYCEKKIHYKKLHVDHVFPLFEGGKNEYSNFVLSCPSCNIRKWTSTPGKPLWITKREVEIQQNTKLNEARKEQQAAAEEIVQEQILEELSWLWRNNA